MTNKKMFVKFTVRLGSNCKKLGELNFHVGGKKKILKSQFFLVGPDFITTEGSLSIVSVALLSPLDDVFKWDSPYPAELLQWNLGM